MNKIWESSKSIVPRLSPEWLNAGTITAIVLSIVVLLLMIIFISIVMFFFLKKKRKTSKRRKLNNEDLNKKVKKFSESIANALLKLSIEKIGSLIVIARNDDIWEYRSNGYEINAKFSPEFAISIFSNKKSALHDGAMLISEFTIFCISSYLPITENTIDIKYGARHRAAIGMSESNDSATFIVSETNGAISCALNGKLLVLSKKYSELAIEIKRILEVQK